VSASEAVSSDALSLASLFSARRFGGLVSVGADCAVGLRPAGAEREFGEAPDLAVGLLVEPELAFAEVRFADGFLPVVFRADFFAGLLALDVVRAPELEVRFAGFRFSLTLLSPKAILRLVGSERSQIRPPPLG